MLTDSPVLVWLEVHGGHTASNKRPAPTASKSASESQSKKVKHDTGVLILSTSVTSHGHGIIFIDSNHTTCLLNINLNTM